VRNNEEALSDSHAAIVHGAANNQDATQVRNALLDVLVPWGQYRAKTRILHKSPRGGVHDALKEPLRAVWPVQRGRA
jgi:hypothetical protein